MSADIEKDWTTDSGLRAIVLWVNDSHRCGYVEVPKSHPFFGKSYNYHLDKTFWDKLPKVEFKGSPIDLLIAAGDQRDGAGPRLSYFVNVHGGLTFAGELKDQSGWWFGFDCAHLDDRTKYIDHGVMRSLEYVTDECESLARQLSILAGEAK